MPALLIRSIVVEEMLHAALAINLLLAVGGRPDVRSTEYGNRVTRAGCRSRPRILPSVPEKVRYEIDLSQPVPIAPVGDQIVRSVTGDDLHGLARLMLDAYQGTIDYDDESIEDAIEEVGSFFDDGEPLLDRSYAVESDGTILSAVLVSLVEGTPFIGYVMTLSSHKNHGLARLVATTAIEHLAGDGHERIVLYITDGNTASEALFRSLGAVQVRP